MRVPRVYIDQPLQQDSEIELPAKQSNYLCKALRMEEGRELWLFNGHGGAYWSCISHAHPKKARVRIGQVDMADRQSPLGIDLGIALSKGDRFDFVVQKATELGVTSIQPLLTERTDVRLNQQRAEKKLEHWRGIVEATCEQSGRNILPGIRGPMTIDEWACSSGSMDSVDSPCKIVLNPEKGISIRELSAVDSEVKVLIGPEGGLSSEEISNAERLGFSSVTLGPRILRTETAPIAIVSLLQALWGDF